MRVCVCVHATLNDLVRVEVLLNLRAMAAIHPLACSHSHENTISIGSLLYFFVFPYTCHIYFIKTRNESTLQATLQSPRAHFLGLWASHPKTVSLLELHYLESYQILATIKNIRMFKPKITYSRIFTPGKTHIESTKNSIWKTRFLFICF